MTTALMRSRKPTESSSWARKSSNCFSRRRAGGASPPDIAEKQQQRRRVDDGRARGGGDGGAIAARRERKGRGGGGATTAGRRRGRAESDVGLGFKERVSVEHALRNADFIILLFSLQVRIRAISKLEAILFSLNLHIVNFPK